MLVNSLPTLTENGMKGPFVVGQCGSGFWSSAVGYTNLEGQGSRKRPSAIDNQHLKILVEEIQRQSFREMSQKFIEDEWEV